MTPIVTFTSDEQKKLLSTPGDLYVHDTDIFKVGSYHAIDLIVRPCIVLRLMKNPFAEEVDQSKGKGKKKGAKKGGKKKKK